MAKSDPGSLIQETGPSSLGQKYPGGSAAGGSAPFSGPRAMTEQQRGLLLTTLGVLAVTPDSLILRLVSFDTPTAIAIRAAVACTVMTLGLAAFHGRALPSVFKALGRAGLIYAVLFAITTFAFLSAVRMTSVANALFIVSTSPIFAALASWVFLGERFSRLMVITTGFALVGIGIIAVGTGEHENASLAGDAVALCAAFALALSFVQARAHKHVSMIPAAALAYVITLAILAPFVSLKGATNTDWSLMLLLAAVFIPFGSSMLAIGPRYITAPEVSLLLLLEAILAPLLVWWLVGENPGPYALVGGAIVIATLFVSNLVVLRRAKPVRAAE